MTVRTPSYLKSRFENGDIPQQTDYEDVFDSFLPLGTSGAQTIDGSIIVLGSITGSAGTFSGPVSAESTYQDYQFLGSNFSVEATATVQASAKILTASISWVTSANGNNFAVALSSAQPGRIRYIVNATNNTALRVFPCVGGHFIGTANNASRSIPQDGSATVLEGPANTYVMIVVGS